MARCQRDYDPTIGRFTALDPARDRRGDGDLYDYRMDDPVMRLPTFPAQAANVLAGNLARRMLKPSRTNGPGAAPESGHTPAARKSPPARFSFRLLSEANTHGQQRAPLGP